MIVYTFKSIGPANNEHTGTRFTEVQVFSDDSKNPEPKKLAHFVGEYARLNAGIFVNALQDKELKQEKGVKYGS